MDLVEELEPHERDDIEQRKNRDGVRYDRNLVETWLDQRRNDPGNSVSIDLEEIENMCSHIGSSIDLVVQVLALCEEPDRAEYLASALVHFGRLGKARFKLSEHMRAATRELVKEINLAFELSTPGVNDRMTARKKARQIIRKIEEMFSSTGVDWKPPKELNRKLG